MQTSDQSPEERLAQKQSEVDTESEAPQAFQGTGDHADAEKRLTSANDSDDEAIRQGLIYPPPPSFYQKEHTPSPPQADSAVAGTPAIQKPEQFQEAPRASRGGAEYVPLPRARDQYHQPYPPYPPYPSVGPSYPPTGPAYPGPYPPYVPPARRSRRWIWILVAVLSVIILASCGICAWASSSIFGSAFQQASSAVYGGRDLTNNYYEAIQNQNYTQAYSYLDPQRALNGLTQAQYVKQAHNLDAQYGRVYKYEAGTPSINYDSSSTNIDHFTIPVDVTRGKKSYQVSLTMYKVGDQWKITDYTTI